MLKSSIAGLCVLVCSSFGWAGEPVAIPSLVWEPYFNASTSTEKGYAREILDYCVSHQERKIIPVETSLKRAMHQLENGQLDLWVMSYRQGREEWLEYSKQALFVDSYSIFVRSDRDFTIAGLDDLATLRVGTMLGLKVSQGFQDFMEKQPEGQKPIEALNEEALVRRLVQGQIDAAVIGTEPFYNAAKRLGLAGEVKVVGQPLRQKAYFAVVSKKSSNIKDRAQFLQELDTCLKDLKQSEYFSDLYSRYLY